eukprot:8662021-Ditylum_brightwellii.AAC.1
MPMKQPWVVGAVLLVRLLLPKITLYHYYRICALIQTTIHKHPPLLNDKDATQQELKYVAEQQIQYGMKNLDLK